MLKFIPLAAFLMFATPALAAPGDSVPADAVLASDGADVWNWVSANPQPFSGTLAHQSTLAAAEHQHYFYAASATLQVEAGESLFAYVYLDPVNPPSELMLQWSDASWEHRAYWGENLIPWGDNGTASQQPMGALPGAGQWVRLEVPASLVALEGSTLSGMNFVLYDGRATFLHLETHHTGLILLGSNVCGCQVTAVSVIT